MIALRRFCRSFPLLTLLFILGTITRGTLASQSLAGEGSGTATQQPPSSSVTNTIPSSTNTAPGSPTPIGQAEEKRILGVLPNYRTAEMSAETTPLTPKQKLRIAMKDSFDYPLVFIGAIYAGLDQAENTHPQFGQGAKGYFKRFGTSYTDQLDGNMLSEGIMPVLFHEDPRYFRMAQGSVKARTWYALSRILITRTDAGHTSFNFSETVGNGIAAGVALSYYSDDRDFGDFVENWATQLATDATSQVLKEFWPDIRRKWHNHRMNKH